jgi:hypothetical protein
MANARGRYDMVAAYLVRHREAREGVLFGKRCLTHDGEPFMMFCRGACAFRVHGRALVQALALPGAQPFDPLSPDKPPPGRPGWVLVPPAQFLVWDRLAMDAMRCVRVSRDRNVSWAVPPVPPAPPPAEPPSPPTSLAQRFANAISGGLSRFTISRD